MKVTPEGYMGGHSLYNLIYDVGDIKVDLAGPAKLIHVNMVPNSRFHKV